MTTKQEAKLKMLTEQHRFYMNQATSIYQQLEGYCAKQFAENEQINEFNKLNSKYEKLQFETSRLKEKIVKLENEQLIHEQNYHCLEKVC